MLYEIDFLINTANRDRLLGIKGKKLGKIITEDIEEFAIRIFLENEEGKILISNTVNTKKDGDEYPNFNIENGEFGESIQNFVVHEVNDIVSDIKIVTDEVEWFTENSIWRIKADVAIIIEFKGSQFLIELVDSLAGFMRYYRNNDCIKLLCDIDTQWSMKTDKLNKSQRIILNL